MKTFLIRDIPEDLMKRCASKLKLNGISMKEFFISCMEEYVKDFNPNKED